LPANQLDQGIVASGTLSRSPLPGTAPALPLASQASVSHPATTPKSNFLKNNKKNHLWIEGSRNHTKIKLPQKQQKKPFVD